MKYTRIPKRLLSLLVLILAGVFAVCISASGEENPDDSNLIWNSGFELLEDENLPDGWYTDAWYSQIGYTEYRVIQDEDPERGQVFEIRNNAPNDARIAQVVDVDPVMWNTTAKPVLTRPGSQSMPGSAATETSVPALHALMISA